MKREAEDGLIVIKDHFRERFNEYTRRAFKMLPELKRPHILDIGCGSGVPTIQLAKLSDGEILGIDINQSLLDRLEKKIEREGLSDRVKIMKCSLFEMDFPDESFDIIWAEGSIWIIGFERGIKEWRRLLKSNGFLVVHDEVQTASDKLEKISSYGYRLTGHFPLPQDAWWIEYCRPLETRIKELYLKYDSDSEALKVLEQCQNEINVIRKNPEEHRSAFYIMKKV